VNLYIATTLLGVGSWEIIVLLNSATVAIGNIVLDSKKRVIQPLEGGNIVWVLVKNGDIVEKNQILIQLSKISPRAKYE
jgi:membrane fusion protein, type I secretion system